MYCLLIILLLLALVILLILQSWKKWPRYRQQVLWVGNRILLFYVTLQLFKYGADKLFKNQFYLPEPNILYTPLGQVDKDLLYWSSMGTSHTYSLFMGGLEVIAATLLLFRTTRLIGLLASFGILVNIVAVNFGFDISVKLFSLFLLFADLILLIPYFPQLRILMSVSHAIPVPRMYRLVLPRFWSSALKWLVFGIIFLEVFYPFIRTRNFNGDNASKPFLHGAYQVEQYVIGKDTLPVAAFPFKRFFIHKDSYFIVQDQEDQFRDYKLAYDPAKSLFQLTGYDLRQTNMNVMYADSVLRLHFQGPDGSDISLTGRQLNWKNMPALRKGFHWVAP